LTQTIEKQRLKKFFSLNCPFDTFWSFVRILEAELKVMARKKAKHKKKNTNCVSSTNSCNNDSY
jgi:hypothetical protein